MDRRKILTLVGLVLFIAACLAYASRIMGPIVGAYWHAYFPSQSQSAPAEPSAGSQPDVPVPPPLVNAPGSEGEAAKALADLEGELTPDKVKSDPIGAVRKLSKVATDYPGTQSAMRATALARSYEVKNAEAVSRANAAGLAEVARVISDTQPRLDRLEHRSVVLIWRALEEKLAGLPAGALAAAQRAKVQHEWDTMPKIELEASQKFTALPPEPIVIEDAAKRLEIAAGADAIAMRYSNAHFAQVAADYRDLQLEKFVEALTVVAQRSPSAARQMGAKMPGSSRTPTPPSGSRRSCRSSKTDPARPG